LAGVGVARPRTRLRAAPPGPLDGPADGAPMAPVHPVEDPDGHRRGRTASGQILDAALDLHGEPSVQDAYPGPSGARTISPHRAATVSGSIAPGPRSTPSVGAYEASANRPPAARRTTPENPHAADARNATPGATCPGVMSPSDGGDSVIRVVATGDTALTWMPWGMPSAARLTMSPSWAPLPSAYADRPGRPAFTYSARPEVVRTIRPYPFARI